jgi:hypothetical protein
LKHLQLKKTRQYWEQIQAELKTNNLELETWALEPRSGHFYARTVSDRVFIEGKGIKGIRTVGYPEFEKVATYYNDYIDDVPGTKQKMRDSCGYNTTYILTLLHRVLEQGDPAPPEPVPVVERKVEPLRLKYTRTRR